MVAAFRRVKEPWGGRHAGGWPSMMRRGSPDGRGKAEEAGAEKHDCHHHHQEEVKAEQVSPAVGLSVGNRLFRACLIGRAAVVSCVWSGRDRTDSWRSPPAVSNCLVPMGQEEGGCHETGEWHIESGEGCGGHHHTSGRPAKTAELPVACLTEINAHAGEVKAMMWCDTTDCLVTAGE